VDARALRRGGDRAVVAVALVAPERDVVARGQRVADEVLEDDGHLPAQRGAIGRRGVRAVEDHPPAVGHVQPGEQLGGRGLARAVGAHERDDLARLDPQRHAAQGRLVGARVGEPDVLGGDRTDRHGRGGRLGRAPLRDGALRDEREVVLDHERRLEQHLGVEAAHGQALAEQHHRPGRGAGLRQREPLVERQRQQQRQGRADHERAGQAGEQRPPRLAARHPRELLDPLVVEAVVAAAQEPGQAHGADLLGGVGQLAPRPVALGRLDVVDREAPHARDPRRTPGGRR
jgi:hypothetical protein